MPLQGYRQSGSKSIQVLDKKGAIIFYSRPWEEAEAVWLAVMDYSKPLHGVEWGLGPLEAKGRPIERKITRLVKCSSAQTDCSAIFPSAHG